jgi:hypothetical protein
MKDIGHQQAFELLPWFVNDTLRGPDRDLVERHLDTCLACRSELKTQRALAALVREQPTISWSAEQEFDRLAPRLDGPDPSRSLEERSWVLPWWHSVTSIPRTLRVGGAVALAAAIAVLVWVGLDMRDVVEPARFTTLTQDSESESLLVDIVFTAGVSEAEMRDLLQEIDGTIVAGPSAIGRYTVRIGDANLDASRRSALLARLTADRRVRFAGWNFITGPDAEVE